MRVDFRSQSRLFSGLEELGRNCRGIDKKSLRHHPQGHNNTSSHAHDEVDTTLQLRRAATVCLLIPNLRFLLPAAKPFNPQPCVQAWANDLGNPTMKAPLPQKKQQIGQIQRLLGCRRCVRSMKGWDIAFTSNGSFRSDHTLHAVGSYSCEAWMH